CAGELRLELVVNPEDAAACFAALRARANEIEQAVGERLTWYEAENYRKRRIYARCAADLYDRSRWPEYYEWYHARLVRCCRVLRRIICRLGREAVTGEEGGMDVGPRQDEA